MDNEIIIVSGLPRSGTSLMMQMLHNGGIEVVTDHVRTADTDNPRGYFEFEQVKKIKQDASWLPNTRGKSFKMVSQLLYDLPACERYRILFMERDLDEMLASQEKMLERLGRPAVPRDQMKRAYLLHLEKLHAWLHTNKQMRILNVRYNELLEKPEEQARRVSEFLDGRVDAEKMVLAVDPSLYRNRRSTKVSAL
jgi:Sulfotransferase family